MYYFISFLLSFSIFLMPVLAEVTINGGSFSSSNLSSNENSQSLSSKSNNAINGLCNNGIIESNSSILEFSENFTLKNHSIVQTDLPQYRSFSFGEVNPKIGGDVSPEIKAIGDLNNDGIDDLVVDFYETSVAPLILLGSKNGKFKKLEYDTTNSARRHIRNGELADLNNDGFLDFVGFTTGDPGKVWIAQGYETYGRNIPKGQEDIVLINIEGRSFKELTVPEVRENDWNHGGTTADLDNNGFVDILPLSEGEKEFTVPLKNIDGKSFLLGKNEYSKDISYYLTSDIDAGDINNDGFHDIVVAVTENDSRTPLDNNKIGTLRVIFGDGDFDFSNNIELKFGTIWLTDEQGEQLVKQFKGKMKAGAGHDASKIITGTSNVELLDVDGDGYLDILEGQYHTVAGVWSGSGFKYYRYNHKGNCFEDATDKFFPNQFTNRNIKDNFFTAYIHNFRMHDINNDGLKDLILQTDGGSEQEWDNNFDNKGYPYIFINDDNKEFLPVKYINNHFSSLSNIDDLVPGDFNGDGKIDLLSFTRNKPHKLRVLLNDINPSKLIKPESNFNKNVTCNFEFVRNLTNMTDEIVKIASGSLNIVDGKIDFTYESWRTGLDQNYEKILKNESNVFIDSYGNYSGYFPIYPIFGKGPKQLLFIDDHVKQIRLSSSPEREIHWINDRDSEIYFKIKYCRELEEIKQNNNEQKKVANKKSNLIKGKYDCKFNINRFNDGANTTTLLAKGEVRIVKGKTIFRNVVWQSGANKDNIPKVFLDKNSQLNVLSSGGFVGFSTIYTEIGNDSKEIFFFDNKFDKDGEFGPMGFHNGLSDKEKKSIDIDVYKCKIIPDIVTAEISNKNNDNKKTKPTLSLKKIELPIDLNKLSIEFYGLTERDDFIKFKGSITDVSGEQFGKGELNFALMFDFKSVTSKKNNKVKDYKITLQANDLKGVSDINIIRACGKKAFWEDDGEIKQINIYIRKFKDNKCSFEKLPLETVKVIQRLASNMILIINDAKFKDPEWNKKIIKLTKKFH